MTSSSKRSLLAPGTWAVMSNSGVAHIALLKGELPSGKALCGAVGTAFVTSERMRARTCPDCLALAGAAAAV
jgi:hypothetical protein